MPPGPPPSPGGTSHEVTKTAHIFSPFGYVGECACALREIPGLIFFWQGALIILPALILAGAGFYSLRQDDVVAQHEAGQQAQQIADEMARRISQSLRFELPDASAVAVPSRLPDDEPVQRLLRSSPAGSACLLDPDGQLLYPPPRRALPPPDPLDAGELSPAQQDAWLALERMWNGGPPAQRWLDAFLTLHPPERFGALARFRTAMALAKNGQAAAAMALLREVAELPAEITGESGTPLRWLAGWQLAALLPAGERSGMLNSVCSRLLLEPSPAADMLFERLVTGDPLGQQWEAVRAAHENARKLYDAFMAAPEVESVSLHRKAHWLVEQTVSGGRWIVAVPLDAVAQLVDRLQGSILTPPHFGVTVPVASHRLLSRPPATPRLGRATLDSPPVTVEVFLADPSTFDAQRRSRTLRFGALIALSACSVMIGFFAAWRAFRRQQQLSEMKSNFVSSVSHELRAPIASVRLMAEELEHGEAPGAEKLRQYLRFIGQECRRLSAVIENVLDFSRREQGREQFAFEAADLSELVRETIGLMQAGGCDRGVQIEFTQRGEACPVNADGRALQRLLVNLIDNAIKHSPDGSPVTVGLEFTPERIFLWVEDCGPGIERAEHGRIFERFYRVGSELRRQTQGVGLGLSIVKHLAEVHGGRVIVRSEPGHGSRFSVELPLRRAPFPQPEELPA